MSINDDLALKIKSVEIIDYPGGKSEVALLVEFLSEKSLEKIKPLIGQILTIS